MAISRSYQNKSPSKTLIVKYLYDVYSVLLLVYVFDDQ